jgi:hypothetical protein
MEMVIVRAGVAVQVHGEQWPAHLISPTYLATDLMGGPPSAHLSLAYPRYVGGVRDAHRLGRIEGLKDRPLAEATVREVGIG